MITVGLYIYPTGAEAKRIELFSDERISVTSSVQDINDISKIFTDFSQSFTVPATPHNNAIFKHWYENSIDGGFDARTRKDAYIELDTIPFRKGKIQLEKAQFKNGTLDNYQITFFGAIVSLKDKFNNMSLRDLNYSELGFSYSGTTVKNRVISNAEADVKFPLISSKNVWQYETNGNTQSNWDITNEATPIFYSDLFPAVRISKLFELIGSNLGITFSGTFLDDNKFKRAFLWLKNENEFTPKYYPSLINFGAVSSTTGNASMFNISNDTLYYTQPDYPEVLEKSNIHITFSDPSIGEDAVEFTIYVYKNGVKLNQQTYLTQITEMYIDLNLDGTGQYQFFISSNSPVTFTSYYFLQTVKYVPSYTIIKNVTATQGTPQTSSSNVSIADFMPNMKLEDFFSGVLKAFNLTCYSEDGVIYNVKQLEDWYLDGTIRDLTKYIISDDLEISLPQLYKSISFKYAEAKNFLAVEYLSRSKTPYGDLLYNMDIDGGEYSIELPFETMLMTKFSDSNLQVGYSLDSNFNPYIPNPVLLYDYGTIQSQEFYFKESPTSTVKLTSYNLFGQDTNVSGDNYTINFGIEQSTYTNQLEQNSLFNTYYLEYLNNIFNSKARIIKLRGILPISLLTKLKLNDRIIIRDKRYIINSFTTDLTNGEVNFDLITDFRVVTTAPPSTGDYSSLDYSSSDYNT
jgi:hypothetical protein